MAGAVTENIENWKSKLDKSLHEKNAVTDLLEKIERKTGVRRLYIALAIIAILAIYLMVGYGAQFLCNFIGFLYPAYTSIKAIESHQKDDDTKWLTYWVTYAFFALVELFTDIFLFWIPFYWLLKCIFLIWCMAPVASNGSQIIYTRVIRPFALKHQDKVDKALDQVGEVLNEAGDAANDMAQDAANQAMRKHFADSSKSD
ncbi:receptor expression-enhancing protein 5-like isoform X2 [Liolophura sinensis]|uniref:receptor expression-enhancing protein 5-like isoform X2 n=1 Tax=Liolophura sinensis TaxID=3198878 RepID=UPI003158976B